MGEGISTRVQKELAQLQQSNEKLSFDMEAMGTQLRAEFQADLPSGLDAGLAKISSELKQTLAGLFQRQEICSQSSHGSPIDAPESPIVELPKSSNTNSSSDFSQTFTKHSKLECPRFNGDDFLGWHSRVEQFFEADYTLEDKTIHIVMMHMDGRALNSHLHFMRTQGDKPVSWLEYILNMHSRFGNSQYLDPLSELVSLRQSDDQSVDDYYDKFEPLLNPCSIDW
ncbi:Retrotransposon gag protein [Corchorus olitorius]|uniref:Retrotransposon gag protein n=1 Tax=Corchorus olitorius TaxID=93759 RepID=A0A1R3HA18_9ROSI|nr:Retrotransposon gag protein [Corchorus olitorius]